MAEIRALPVRPRGSDQSDRLHADLAAAHARGATLGSRAPHIQASGERLLELSGALECAIEALELSLIELGVHDPSTDEALRGFVMTAENLANTAQHIAKTTQSLGNSTERFPPTH